MKISTGMSEIALSRANRNAVSEKIYLWPEYGQNKISKIKTVTRQTDTNITYTKPSPEDHISILERLQKPSFTEYTGKGTYGKNIHFSYQPGTLFDAVV